jgi:hypothetical protein
LPLLLKAFADRDVEDRPFRAAAGHHRLDLGELPVGHLQPQRQHHRRASLLDDDVRGRNAVAHVEEILPVRSQP